MLRILDDFLGERSAGGLLFPSRRGIMNFECSVTTVGALFVYKSYNTSHGSEVYVTSRPLLARGLECVLQPRACRRPASQGRRFMHTGPPQFGGGRPLCLAARGNICCLPPRHCVSGYFSGYAVATYVAFVAKEELRQCYARPLAGPVALRGEN